MGKFPRVRCSRLVIVCCATRTGCRGVLAGESDRRGSHFVRHGVTQIAAVWRFRDNSLQVGRRTGFVSGDFDGYTDNTDMNILPSQSSQLARLMNAAELRHSVISHNLANVNTPGYRRLEVVFEEALQEAGGTSPSGEPAPQPIVREEQGLPVRADGNNVDIDREAVQLDKNALTYQTYSQLLATQLQMMRKAVEG